MTIRGTSLLKKKCNILYKINLIEFPDSNMVLYVYSLVINFKTTYTYFINLKEYCK